MGTSTCGRDTIACHDTDNAGQRLGFTLLATLSGIARKLSVARTTDRRSLARSVRLCSFRGIVKNTAVICIQMHRSRRRSIGRRRHVSASVAAPNRWCISILARGLSCISLYLRMSWTSPPPRLQRGRLVLFRALLVHETKVLPAADVATGTPHFLLAVH